MSIRTSVRLSVVLSALLLTSPILAGDENEKSLLDVSADGAEKALTGLTAGQVTVSHSKDVPGVVVEVAAGDKDYPGATLKPKDARTWDLSAFERIEIRITNTGTDEAAFGVNVENEGKWQDAPWNTEETTLDPGQTKTLTVTFGTSFGNPGYALKTDAVTSLRMYTKKREIPATLRIESVKAAGTAKKQ